MSQSSTVYVTRRKLEERYPTLDGRTVGQWLERECPEAVLRMNSRVILYALDAVERFELRKRGAGELHQGE